MSKTSGKIKYLAMNLLAPGIAQFALHWWLRGLLQLGGAVVCFILAAWCVIGPLVHNISRMLNDDSAKIENVNFVGFFYYAVALIVIWIWSILDIIIFYSPKQTVENNNENEGECSD